MGRGRVGVGSSIQMLAVWALTSSMGFMLSDVTTDAILVERSKHEPSATRGSMQAIGYSVRFVGRCVQCVGEGRGGWVRARQGAQHGCCCGFGKEGSARLRPSPSPPGDRIALRYYLRFSLWVGGMAVGRYLSVLALSLPPRCDERWWPQETRSQRREMSCARCVPYYCMRTSSRERKERTSRTPKHFSVSLQH